MRPALATATKVFDMTSNPILPRQGEVAPKATEGEEARRRLSGRPPPPTRYARHLPLAGED